MVYKKIFRYDVDCNSIHDILKGVLVNGFDLFLFVNLRSENRPED